MAVQAQNKKLKRKDIISNQPPALQSVPFDQFSAM